MDRMASGRRDFLYHGFNRGADDAEVFDGIIAHIAGAARLDLNRRWSVPRALLLALDRWVAEGVAPPPSAYPRFQDGTLVAVADVRFPPLPGLPSPAGLRAGVRRANPFWPEGAGAGAPLPLFVPALDADGNERGGVLLPEAAAPLATATGFAFAAPLESGHRNLVPLRGAWVPFATTEAVRRQRGDVRPSLQERCGSRDRYLALVRDHAQRSVRAGYLLAQDVDEIVRRAGVKWDWIHARPAP